MKRVNRIIKSQHSKITTFFYEQYVNSMSDYQYYDLMITIGRFYPHNSLRGRFYFLIGDLYISKLVKIPSF